MSKRAEDFQSYEAKYLDAGYEKDEYDSDGEYDVDYLLGHLYWDTLRTYFDMLIPTPQKPYFHFRGVRGEAHDLQPGDIYCYLTDNFRCTRFPFAAPLPYLLPELWTKILIALDSGHQALSFACVSKSASMVCQQAEAMWKYLNYRDFVDPYLFGDTDSEVFNYVLLRKMYKRRRWDLGDGKYSKGGFQRIYVDKHGLKVVATLVPHHPETPRTQQPWSWKTVDRQLVDERTLGRIAHEMKVWWRAAQMGESESKSSGSKTPPYAVYSTEHTFALANARLGRMMHRSSLPKNGFALMTPMNDSGYYYLHTNQGILHLKLDNGTKYV